MIYFWIARENISLRWKFQPYICYHFREIDRIVFVKVKEKLNLYKYKKKWMMTYKYKNNITKLYQYKYRNNYTIICIRIHVRIWLLYYYKTNIYTNMLNYSYKYTYNYMIILIRIHVSIPFQNCGLLYEYHWRHAKWKVFLRLLQWVRI